MEEHSDVNRTQESPHTKKLLLSVNVSIPPVKRCIFLKLKIVPQWTTFENKECTSKCVSFEHGSLEQRRRDQTKI
ncbi:hypothetical protein PDJAM_G00048810 [Pangasius djambal]|uniref:Uncharacterized protein n=1 Tax=Pangasius djambal TaxID=1691987 RepID=A0ACC5YV37_9TELE|nr:hypothetical protein [Pangasius djambal]